MASNIVNPRIRNHHITGNLTADPKLVPRRGAEPIVVFRLADNQQKFNRETNSWQDAGVTFYDVAITKNQQLAENVMASMQEGNRVTVVGTYTAEPFVTAAGAAELNHKVWADEVSASMAFHQVTVRPSVRQERAQVAAATATSDAQAGQQFDAPGVGSDTNFDPSFR